MINQNAIDRYNQLVKKEWLLPILVSPFFQKKVDKEIAVLWHENGPLTRIVYPNDEKVDLIINGEYDDWVDDRSNMVASLDNRVIRKYKNRILYMPTVFCASNCQYCFRQDVLDEARAKKEEGTRIIQDIKKIERYLEEDESIEEVILSGWDPMMLPAKSLRDILEMIKKQGKWVRIHTKIISYNPALITKEKIAILKNAQARVVFHITHPYEICETVANKAREMWEEWIRLYNQFPLLRGINDHLLVLDMLLKKLDELSVRNLSIFIADPIKHSWAFRIRLARIIELINTLNWNSSSWVNSTRFVLDSNIGKLRREDIIEYNPEDGYAIFRREWKTITYPDFPEAYDIPWDIKTLLWKWKEL